MVQALAEDGELGLEDWPPISFVYSKGLFGSFWIFLDVH